MSPGGTALAVVTQTRPALGSDKCGGDGATLTTTRCTRQNATAISHTPAPPSGRGSSPAGEAPRIRGRAQALSGQMVVEGTSGSSIGLRRQQLSTPGPHTVGGESQHARV